MALPAQLADLLHVELLQADDVRASPPLAQRLPLLQLLRQALEFLLARQGYLPAEVVPLALRVVHQGKGAQEFVLLRADGPEAGRRRV